MTLTRVVVINDASQAFGGATGLALLNVRLLRARGIDVTYVCGDTGDNDDLKRLGVRVVAAGGARLLNRRRGDAFSRGIHNSDTRDMLARLIAEDDTPGTVYHLHGWAQILSPSIFSALAPVAARCYIHAHDMFLACPNGVYMDYQKSEPCTRVPLSGSCLLCNCDKRSYLHKGWRVLRQHSLRRCFDLSRPWAGIVMIHPGMRPHLMRAGYPDGLLRDLRNPVRPFSETRIRAEENRTLAYVGRLEEDKGVLQLAAAARRTGLHLVFIGEGAMRARLEREYPDARVTGWQTREGIAAHIARARALVLPSIHPEPFGLVVPEAVESGLPVAVAQTAMLARDVVDAGYGLAFDVHDPQSFDGALRALAEMPDPRIADMSKRGFDRVTPIAETEADWVQALVGLYQSVAA
ncbi:MAG: glycosyltransferase [Rhodobacteraceae bacterium]|nr:glycosyltransferase [Paracoccaceae bacterium]